MRVLVIGGSGLVGSMITPYLALEHDLTIFDLKPPSDPAPAYIRGDLTRYDQLAAAIAKQDALVYMAMGSLDWQTVYGINTAFDVNVKGLHLALKAAQEASITQAVYTSSMSVYADLAGRKFADETATPDARHLYGFTKSLGEQVCLNAVRNWDMHINVLRLCFPTPDVHMQEVEPEKRILATAASDVARAVSAALSFRGRYQTFMISGDFRGTMLNMSKAKLLLGWQPKRF